MPARILWTNGPPRVTKARPGRILKVPPGSPIEVRCLSTHPLPVWTHYILGQGTVPCTMDTRIGPESCSVDHRTTSMRWQAWIACQLPLVPEIQYAALTQDAVERAPWIMHERESQRGKTLLIGRRGGFAKSPMSVGLSQNDWSDRKMMQEPDVREFLEFLWGDWLSNVQSTAPARRKPQ